MLCLKTHHSCYHYKMSITQTIDHISTDTVARLAKNLNQVLAESYGLLSQLHLAHWNVEGPHFLTLHEMFQTQYEEVFTAVDEIAERVRALGFYAEGGLKKLASMSTVAEGPSGAGASAQSWVSSAILAHEVVIAAALKTRKMAGEAGDAETEDLLIARISSHQKAVWFLNSFLK